MCSCQLAIDLNFYMSKDFISLVDPDLLKDVKDVNSNPGSKFQRNRKALENVKLGKSIYPRW